MNPSNITIELLDKDAQTPYELLLLADPSKDLINAYLKESEIFVAKLNREIVGVIVLYPVDADSIEIKNIAVKPEFQNQGIGSFLMENTIRIASDYKEKSICIGTANSSVGQIRLYQKLGFEISGIKKDFFIENYAEPIFENGIQAKDLMILTRQY